MKETNKTECCGKCKGNCIIGGCLCDNCPTRYDCPCHNQPSESKCEGCMYSKDKSKQMARFTGAHCFCPTQQSPDWKLEWRDLCKSLASSPDNQSSFISHGESFISTLISKAKEEEREKIKEKVAGMKQCDEKECYKSHDCNLERIKDSALDEVIKILNSHD